MTRRRLVRIGLAIVWVAVGLSSIVAWWMLDIPIADIPRQLSEWLQRVGTVRAVGLFLILYLFRPLILFPSTALGLASGLTFGPTLGFVVTMLGEVFGAGTAFSVTRVFGRRWVSRRESRRLARWDQKLTQRGVATVAVLRLLWLPFDSVSFACGLTGVRFIHFLIGSALGGSFFIVSVTMFGGSASAGLEGSVNLLGMSISQRGAVLLLGGVSFLTGAAIAWRLRHHFIAETQEIATDAIQPAAAAIAVDDAPGP